MDMETDGLRIVSELIGNGMLASVLLWLLVDERKQRTRAVEEHLKDLREAKKDE